MVFLHLISDGGTPIEKYIIEKKPKFGDWTKACEVSGKTPKARVPDLKEGEEYQFRVVVRFLRNY